MRIKRGLKLWSINTNNYLKEAQKLYEEELFDYIELSIIPDSLYTLKKWKELQIPYIIHNPHSAQGFCLSKKEFESENMRIFDQTKIFADELSSKYIIFHGGIGGDINESIRQLNIINDKRAIIENKPKIVDGLKYKNIDCIGYLPSEIKQIMSETNCGFCLDFGHAICASNALEVKKDNFIDEFLQIKPNMFHLTNLKDIDSPYDSHEHLDDGELDIKEILKRVPNGSFVTFEMKKDFENSLDDFKNDMLWLQNRV